MDLRLKFLCIPAANLVKPCGMKAGAAAVKVAAQIADGPGLHHKLLALGIGVFSFFGP